MNNNDFIYQAKLYLPKTDINKPASWLTDLYTLESWLNQHIGTHMQDWAYVITRDNLTVGFKKPEHKTFFLIYYDK